MQDDRNKEYFLFPSIIRTKEFLRDAILNNDFMKNLEMDQILSIVDCMYPLEHQDGSLIIKEGDVGNLVYILEGKEYRLTLMT